MYELSKSFILSTVSIVWAILLMLVVLTSYELYLELDESAQSKLVVFVGLHIVWTLLTLLTFKLVKD
jgi:hypothetical protein